MSNELEIKKLLEYRVAIERKIVELEAELNNLKEAISILDKTIVSQGFRALSPHTVITDESTPNQSIPTKPMRATPPESKPEHKPAPVTKPQPLSEEAEAKDEGSSVTSKNGTILGKINVIGRDLTFRPLPEYNFTSNIPPFQSFLLERVLQNMKDNDLERASNGEIEQDETLEFIVVEKDDRIKEIHISNYGGERRLREITSSLRWTFDKMYDKLQQG